MFSRLRSAPCSTRRAASEPQGPSTLSAAGKIPTLLDGGSKVAIFGSDDLAKCALLASPRLQNKDSSEVENMTDSERVPLTDSWGSISEVVNAPPINVPHDSWWISVIFLWLTLPVWIVLTIPTFCSSWIFVVYLIGFCNISVCITFSALGSVKWGRPLFLAPNIYRAWLSTLWAFLLNGATRARLFNWAWEAFGKGRYWYHGEGIWCWTYADVSKILKGVQMRKTAFGCVRAPTPDFFASNLLIFLPNTIGDSEWKAIRFAMHSVLFDGAEKRVKALGSMLAAEWLKPKLTDLNDVSFLQKVVAQSVFWALFGVWLDDTDAKVLSQWNNAAPTAIFPRLFQRFVFNLFINRMKSLREDTVRIIEKHGLQSRFYEMNSLLGRWRRDSVVKLCDEMMWIVCFAGVSGVASSAVSTVAFLQNQKPPESDAANIDLSRYPTQADMEAIYKRNPNNYIKEAGRIDPPVTSATTSLAEDGAFALAGQERTLDTGTLNQYVISRANRDPQEFDHPSLFNPDRSDLHKALTFNGVFQGDNREQEEHDYPRICPGRYLALDIVRAIVNHAIGNTGA